MIKLVHFPGVTAQGHYCILRYIPQYKIPPLSLKNSLNYYFSLQVHYLINKVKHVLYKAKITVTIFNQFHLRAGDFCDMYLHLACVSINNFHFLN